MAVTRTNGKVNGVVGDAADGVLEVVDDNRGQNSLAGSGRASDSKVLARALEEAGEVRPDPEAGKLLALMSEVGGAISDAGDNAVIGRKPRLDGVDLGD